jgi:hypothetical protein
VFEQVARRLRSVPASVLRLLPCSAPKSALRRVYAIDASQRRREGGQPRELIRHRRDTPSQTRRPRAAGSHEAEFDAFLLGALAESKVDNPDWEDALEGQAPFAGGAAPAAAPAADDGPDTQPFKGDDDDDDFD